MEKRMTLGSLFDGIGGWQIAAVHAGVMPVWSSEIEPFPIAVTAHHFPGTKQLGDITRIDGAEIEPVDIVCAGSPCQDLSIAGKREGLKGARSGLFHRAIELVRQMRKSTRGGQPRFFVWENVSGAYSSNNGADFRAVLEEIADAKIPVPEGGRWANAGLVECDSCQIAWITKDAQYFGVPQRRKRIFLVADFGARKRCAGKILFERQSMFRHSSEGKEAREGAAEGTGSGTQSAGGALTPWDTQARRIMPADGMAATITTRDGHGAEPGNVYVPKTARTLTSKHNAGYCSDGRGMTIVSAGFKAGQGSGAGSIGYAMEKAATLSAKHSGLEPSVAVYDMTHAERHAVCVGNGQMHQTQLSDKVGALNAMHDQQCVMIAPRISKTLRTGGNLSHREDADTLVCQGVASSVDCRNFREQEEISGTLQAKENPE